MKIARKVLALALMVMLLASIAAPAFARGRGLGTKYVVNCDEWVTLREYPSTQAYAVTRVWRGEKVTAYAYNGEFTECEYNGLHGYILSYYLSSSKPRPVKNVDPDEFGYEEGDYIGTMRVVNCREWVTLRSRPSTSASAVVHVPLGAKVEGYWYNSRFVECYYHGMHGYILADYLS